MFMELGLGIWSSAVEHKGEVMAQFGKEPYSQQVIPLRSEEDRPPVFFMAAESLFVQLKPLDVLEPRPCRSR